MASRMNLGSVVKGKLARPVRVLVHGTEGVGKSTFAADAPKPIFLCSEDGTAQLEIERFPEPRTWAEALEAVDELDATHDYKTLVVDTLDWLEPLAWAHVCKAGKKESIEDFGYGKGYTAALDQWRLFASKLDRLRNHRAMNIVLVAHSWIRPFANPEGENFDRYELKLHKAAAGLLKEWSDAVLFATWEQATVKDGSKAKGISTGSRVMRTERRAAFDAKNRYGLPFEMPLSWTEFFAAVQRGEPESAEALTAEALKLGESAGIEVKDHIARAAGDVTKLAKLVDWARGKASQKEHSNAA